MNVPGPRKPSTASPTVQVQAQAPQRIPQQYPRGPTPPVNYRPEVFERSALYQPQQFTQVQQVSQPQVQQATQQLRGPAIYQSYHAGGPPHDLSKSPMSTHVPQTGPSPQQAGIQQQQSMMYPGTQQGPRPGAPVQNFIPARPQSGPRQARPTMNMTQAQHVNYLPGPTTMFMPSAQPAYMGGHQVITLGGTPQMQVQYAQQGPRIQAPAQYSITTTQPTSYSISPSFYPQQPGNAVYYPSTTAPSTPAVRQAYKSSRPKTILKITDPNTGKDISEEILTSNVGRTNTPPQSQSGSSRATPVGTTPPPAVVTPQPPPPPRPGVVSEDIAAQFAAQVAATLHNRPASGSPALQPVTPHMSQQVMGPPPHGAQISAPPRIVGVPGQVAQPRQPVPVALVSPVGPPVVHNPGPPTQQFVVNPQPPIAVVAEPTEPAVVTVAVEAETSPEPVEVEVVSPPESTSQETPKQEPEPEVESPVSKEATPEPVVPSKEATPEPVVKPEPQPDVVEPKERTPEPTIVIEPPSPVSRTQSEADSERMTEEVEEDTTPDVVPKDIGKPPVSPRGEDDGKEPRKKGKKQRMRELNEKGESKEGSEMDAFAVEQASAKAEIEESDGGLETVDTKAPSEEPQIATSNGPVSLKDSKTETQESDKVETNAEVDKVAEENEKNDEKSDDSKETEENKDNTVESAVESTDASLDDSKHVIKKQKSAELKYKYREHQWSPLNPEGKKQYDRSFLLQLQTAPESMEKPLGLPKLPDVILDTPITNSERQYGPPQGRRAVPPDFTPGFIKSSPSGKGPIGKRNSAQKMGGRGSMGQPHKVIQHTMGHTEVKLHQSENKWKPPNKLEKTQDPEAAKTEELYKKIKGILNKLTPQKFQTLLQQVLDLEIDTEERLAGCIDIIFEKAISEPNFSVAYGNMCKYMINCKVPAQDKPEKTVTFKGLLLNRCQKEFEKDKAAEVDMARREKEIAEAPEDKKKELEMLKDAAESIAKRRSLGNIRFIGELFKLKMLTENIMHDCLLKLLRSNDEDNLECLCRLLSTIGKDIDVDRAKARVDQYFVQMDKIVKQKRTSARVRFMLQDVAELRGNKWVPRRDDNNPKTIEQIHREAQEEEQQKAIMIQNINIPSNKGRPGRGRGGGGGGNTPNPAGDDGWQSVGRSNRNIIDPTRMKLTKQNVDENIQLGPGGRPGFGSWGRGSSGGGGSKNPSQEGEKPSTPANRFSALSAENYDPRRASGGLGGRGNSRDRGDRGGRMSQDRDRGNRRGGNISGRASQEQDRESALAAVRNIASGGRSQSGGRQNSGSRNQSRDSSRNRDIAREEKVDPKSLQVPKELSESELEKKTRAIMDEYLQINDLKEAMLCVKELESPKSIYLFVYHGLSHVLERSNQARSKAGTLLHDLVKQKMLTVDQYMRGLNEVLEVAEDMEIDIPKIWQYLGQLISPMVQDSSIQLSFLKTACAPLVENKKAGLLVAEVLNDACHRLGHQTVGDLWRKSGLQWADFLPASESIPEFIKKYSLEYTQGSEEPRSPEGKSLPMDLVQKELNRLIVEKKVTNEEVFDWIDTNVGEIRLNEPRFIRALMTSVCTAALHGQGSRCQVLQEQIVNRTLLLQKYLDHKAELELQALYALQALVHRLEHPPGVLRGIFDTLYDEDIISEDAFNQWEQGNDPAEQAGKGVALTSVLQFFTWLREAEEDDQEN